MQAPSAGDPQPTVTNVNIENPTLTVAHNDPVTPGGDMRLVWSDEFDQPRLNPERWFFESGDGSQYGNTGWGNNELQWYLPDSAEVVNGRLILTARREPANGKDFTSARISTVNRFAFRYGRIEARMRLPGGQGLWPAFWLLPQDKAYGGWAASGEIDVVEAVNLGGSGDNNIVGSLHFGGSFPDNTSSGNEYLVATDVKSEFHVYAIEWDAAEIRWYVDSTLFSVQNSWWTSAADFPAPFDQPFYILINIAVGGDWPGNPVPTTVFPVSMEVDYVRVYSGITP